MKIVQTIKVAPRATVRTAYDCMDAIFTSCDIRDLTEGIYNRLKIEYNKAQCNQRRWLLDQMNCRAGSRLLDVGCGYGTLLAEAQQRGAKAIGITLSSRQASYCKKLGLTVYVCDYRDFDNSWKHSFDCIVANGSIEHFVQPIDVLAGRQDAIYREFFSICHHLIDPASSAKRLATTIIHFDRFRPDPFDILKSPWRFPWGSDNFHAAMLEHCLGGFYPVNGQLKKCADPFFTLKKAVDGTEDYRLTSEQWLNMIRQSFLRPDRLGLILGKLLPHLFTAPGRIVSVIALLFAESWQWQFRGEHPPTKLWRHIWQYT